MTRMQDIKSDIMADTLSKRDGIYTARKGFYYRHGGTSEAFAERIEQVLNAKILDHGEVWKDFRGGSSVANQSHWWVKFKLNE